jgi:hypothetical protein
LCCSACCMMAFMPRAYHSVSMLLTASSSDLVAACVATARCQPGGEGGAQARGVSRRAPDTRVCARLGLPHLICTDPLLFHTPSAATHTHLVLLIDDRHLPGAHDARRKPRHGCCVRATAPALNGSWSMR